MIGSNGLDSITQIQYTFICGLGLNCTSDIFAVFWICLLPKSGVLLPFCDITFRTGSSAVWNDSYPDIGKTLQQVRNVLSI